MLAQAILSSDLQICLVLENIFRQISNIQPILATAYS